MNVKGAKNCCQEEPSVASSAVSSLTAPSCANWVYFQLNLQKLTSPPKNFLSFCDQHHQEDQCLQIITKTIIVPFPLSKATPSVAPPSILPWSNSIFLQWATSSWILGNLHPDLPKWTMSISLFPLYRIMRQFQATKKWSLTKWRCGWWHKSTPSPRPLTLSSLQLDCTWMLCADFLASKWSHELDQGMK